MMVINLKNRLMLTYMLFICISVSVLTFFINLHAENIFAEFTKSNIENQSGEIVNSIAELYDPFTGRFDLIIVEAMGMYFVHKGYIISIQDSGGQEVWNARSIDNERCAAIIREITARMENEYRLNGSLYNRVYPIEFMGNTVGKINVETYGPFFYSEGEAGFLDTLNRFMVIAGLAFTLVSMVISFFLASDIARPIRRATEAAHQIAGGKFSIRITDNYRTRELRELSYSINELAGELENGEQWQKRLTNDIAHELRTPLTSLQGNIEAMIDGVWQPTRELLENCLEEIVQLSKLIEDMNELSILERENMVLNKTRFDLRKLLKIAAAQFLPAARKKKIALNLNLAEVIIYADYDRLMQVFNNLLSNALNYTDRGSITVTVTPPEASGVTTRAEITVADTGIGIAESEVPHVFERFYRSDKSRSRHSGGAGIGLTIVETIVKAHGGQVSVESENGRGSVFRVLLPVLLYG